MSILSLLTFKLCLNPVLSIWCLSFKLTCRILSYIIFIWYSAFDLHYSILLIFREIHRWHDSSEFILVQLLHSQFFDKSKLEKLITHAKINYYDSDLFWPYEDTICLDKWKNTQLLYNRKRSDYLSSDNIFLFLPPYDNYMYNNTKILYNVKSSCYWTTSCSRIYNSVKNTEKPTGHLHYQKDIFI